MRPEIRRGSDSTFKIYLRREDGRPYDLTGVTYMKLKLPKENIGAVTVDSEETPAVAATAVSEVESADVTFTATTAGTVGNDIELEFDGTDSLDDVVSAWNTANPSNQVEHDGTGADVPEAQTVTLAGGVNAYTKVTATTPLQLGEVNVTLSEADTALLKLGKNQSLELTVDKGDSPAGQRKVIILRDAVAVEERFF